MNITNNNDAPAEFNNDQFKSQYMRVSAQRGYLYQCSHLMQLDEAFAQGEVTAKPCVAYVGFDATADSLHVGSLLQIMRLRLLQQLGHKPIILVGGGTTRIGDPSGKDQTRSLLDDTQIHNNIDGITGVLKKFIKFGDAVNDATIVNNHDWLGSLNYVDFLRDIGGHFSINRMLSFESVKMRLQREQNLSFLEFNYMILQAYDFLHLYNNYNCTLQMGGADQWGNIISGVELVRRVVAGQAYGLTCPLITTANGAKMGKTAQGATWLCEDKLSSFDFWQYWRNTHDDDVVKFLYYFSELDNDEIVRLSALQGSEINDAKIALANAVTAITHGVAAAQKAAAAAGGKGNDEALPVIDLPQGNESINVMDIFIAAKLCQSKGEVKRLIAGGGAKINDNVVTDMYLDINQAQANDKGYIKLSAGKKRHLLVKI